jgi:spermidine synthase
VKKQTPTLPAVSLSESGGIRYLHLETPWVQGAMRISKPLKLELDYIQRMMAWMLLQDPAAWPQARTLHLGMGAASLTKYCHSVLKVPTTVVEINPVVIAVCRAYFHLPNEDERLTVVQADAGKFVTRSENVASYDALCVDLYDHEAASPVLDDVAFYQACWQVLDDGGVMTVNLFGREASFDVSASRIQQAFGAERVAAFKPTREGNAIVMAWKGFDLPGRDALVQRSEAIQAMYDLPASKWVKLLSPYRHPES